jgi:hypothetical protein
MLECNLDKRLEKNYVISFYKMGDWKIFFEANVMYLCTQKHKYSQKIYLMILNLYES